MKLCVSPAESPEELLSPGTFPLGAYIVVNDTRSCQSSSYKAVSGVEDENGSPAKRRYTVRKGQIAKVLESIVSGAEHKKPRPRVDPCVFVGVLAVHHRSSHSLLTEDVGQRSSSLRIA